MRTTVSILVLLLLTVGVYWKLTLSDQYTWLEDPDQAFQVRPWLDYQAREVHHGTTPLWDPLLMGGQTLVGQVQPGTMNPVNWLLFWVRLDNFHIPIRNLHWYWVLIRWLGAVFAFFLCRDLKASYLASILGACAYGFMGFVGHAGTPQFVMCAIWIPLVLMGLARIWRGERLIESAAFCGAAMGMQFLSGHHNIPIYTALLTGALWLWRIRSRKMAVVTLVGLTIFILVSAAQTFPAVEYGRLALRWSGAPQPQKWDEKVPYSVHAEYSLGGISVPGIVAPGLSLHANPFVGTVVFSLALIGAFRRRRTSDGRLLMAFGAGGLILALGSATPVHRLLYEVIPMVDKARYPAQCIVLLQAALAALAALGLDELRKQRAGWPAVAVIGVLSAALFVYASNKALVHPAWFAAGAAAALAVTVRWLRAAPVLVIALFFVECIANPPSILHQRHQPGSYEDLIASHNDIALFLRSRPGWFRVEFDPDAVPYNFGDFYDFEQWGGYTASMPVKTFQSLGDAQTLRRMGVRYYVGKAPRAPQVVEVFQSSSGLKVYEAPGFDTPIWVERSKPCTGTDQINIVWRRSQSERYRVELACPGYIVSGDYNYPGWRVWVDNKISSIREAQGSLRSVHAQAGKHLIIYRYQPNSVAMGQFLSLLGLIFTAVISTYVSAQTQRRAVAAAGNGL